MKRAVDFLIVGQGLAGSLLGFELIQRGFKIAIIDHGLENASKMAAGLINPVTGMRLVKSSQLEMLLPAAHAYYHQLGEFFQKIFYIEKPMKRFLTSDKLLKSAKKRLKNPDYQPYLGKITLDYLMQKQTGYLLTTPLLKALKAFFIDQECYQKGVFNYQGLQLAKNVYYQTIEAEKLIFCEGYLARDNPWFSSLPFQLVKGEILTLEVTQPLNTPILNYGYWMIPLANNRFRTGATFDRETIDTHTTRAAKTLLLKSLQAIEPKTLGATCLHHEANIRPCTLDKQPFIGLHPQYQQLGIFNGFGAKGSLQIPYYCQQFADALSAKGSLLSSVDIQRYRCHLS